MDKVKGFGEGDAFPSDEAKARWIWPEFARPTDRTAFLRNADNSISGFNSLLVCQRKPTAGVSGWRSTTLSGGIGRWKGIDLATFRVDCLAIRETELRQYCRTRLYSYCYVLSSKFVNMHAALARTVFGRVG